VLANDEGKVADGELTESREAIDKMGQENSVESAKAPAECAGSADLESKRAVDNRRADLEGMPTVAVFQAATGQNFTDSELLGSRDALR
jgi:hypothetical protein